MIKQILAVATLLSFFGFSQINKNSENEYFKLNWKIQPHDTLVYQTFMSDISGSEFEMNLQGMLGDMIDSLDAENKKFHNDLFEKLKKLYANTNLETRLSHSSNFDGIIDIEMVATPNSNEKVEKEEDGMGQMMQSMLKGTMLRGSVHPTGKLHSFWVKNAQKNLLSLFFELPDHSVKVGDHWTLDNVNLIGNDQNFVCTEAKKRNLVTLTEVKEVNGDSIALIDYDILEYVSGNFNVPAFFDKENSQQKTVMKFIYKAQAEFSINKGKWISYNGIMSLDASGVFKSAQKQKFALVEK